MSDRDGRRDVSDSTFETGRTLSQGFRSAKNFADRASSIKDQINNHRSKTDEPSVSSGMQDYSTTPGKEIAGGANSTSQGSAASASQTGASAGKGAGATAGTKGTADGVSAGAAAGSASTTGAAASGSAAGEAAAGAGATAGGSAAGGSAAGEAIAASGPWGWLVIAIIVAVFLISFTAILCSTELTSQAQMDEVYKLSPEGAAVEEYRTPNNPQLSLYDQDYAKKQTEKLLTIIDQKKASDRETQIKNMQKDIVRMGYDLDLSMQLFEETSETVSYNLQESNSNEVKQSFSLSGFSDADLKTFPVVNQNQAKAKGFDLYSTSGYQTDSTGICRYQAVGSADYVVKMPVYFGGDGNRYLVSFTDGSQISVVKVGDITENTGILQTAVTFTTYNSSERANCSALPFYGKTIKQIDLVHSEFADDVAASLSQASNRVLAAFSVAMDNGQIKKVGLGKYVNNLGLEVKTYKFGDKAGELNYEKSLKTLLDDYTSTRGHFYDIEYEMEGDHIKVYTYKVKHVETYEYETTDPETGEVTTHTGTYVWYEYFYYVHPILVEKDIDSMAEDIFNLDVNSVYQNSGESEISQITVGEAISQISRGTMSVLYNLDVSCDIFYASGFNGIFEWPAPGNFRVTSAFGYRTHPVTHAYTMHTGIDIAGVTGSPVVAADEGTVTFAGSSGTYGNLIKISHPDGTETRYAHLSAIAVYAGQSVARGQQIGLVGSTGQSTGPHLHFEVRVNNSPSNPLSWICTQDTAQNITISY